MSDRFSYLYGPAIKFNLRALVDYFSSRGITLENPSDGRVTSLSEYGDQLETSLEILETAVANHNPVTFQFWLAGDADVCCRIRHLSSNRLVEEYSLVGLFPEEIDRILSTLIERFKSKAADEGNLFFVADRNGYTMEVDWDELSLGGKYEFALCPDVLGIPYSRLNDFEKCLAESRTMQIGKYLILDLTKLA